MSTAVPVPFLPAPRRCCRPLDGEALCGPCSMRAAHRAAGLTVDEAVAHLWTHAVETRNHRDGEGDEVERACPVTLAKVLYLGAPSQDARDHFAYQVTRVVLSDPRVRERVIADVLNGGVRVAS